MFSRTSFISLLLIGAALFTQVVAQPLPYEDSRFGIFAAYVTDYGYFKGRMGFTNTQYWSWVDGHFKNLGAHWTRSNMELVWDFIEPTLDSTYNWNPQPFITDSVIVNIYKQGNQVHWLGVFHNGALFGERPGGEQRPLRDPLSDTLRYNRFVRNVVERYDGDGFQDVNSYVRVRHWQMGNEVLYSATSENRSKYVRWVRTAANAVRAADPTAKIVLIAQTQGFWLDPWLREVILELGSDRTFDVVDIHHWGRAVNYKMPAVRQTRQLLDSLGLSHVQIWSCENGTWAYKPSEQPFYQTQEEQARSLIQRYVYNIDLGLNKLFWNNLMEWIDFRGEQGSVYNSMGLIGDGMRNEEPPQNFNQPRVSYFVYKFLAQAIDVDNARDAGKMSIHQEPNLYAYRYVSLSSDSAARYVLWRDSGSQTVTFRINTPRALVINMIPDSLGNFATEDTVHADGQGNVTISVGIDPLLVRELSGTTSIQDGRGHPPREFQLYQNYPNPFNPTTTIKFLVPSYEFVSLKVYDVLGREVATLVDGELNPGEYSVVFDAQGLSCGVCFYRLSAGSFVDTKKMLVIK